MNVNRLRSPLARSKAPLELLSHVMPIESETLIHAHGLAITDYGRNKFLNSAPELLGARLIIEHHPLTFQFGFGRPAIRGRGP